MLKGRSGKTATKTWEKVLQAYKGGITSPYELSEMFLLKVGTVRAETTPIILKVTKTSANVNAFFIF